MDPSTMTASTASDSAHAVNPSFFHGAHHFSMTGVQLTEIVIINNHPAPTQTSVPPLPLLKHSSTFFVGRDEYLQKLKSYFNPYGDQRRSYLLYGLGGIGKTQICLKFIEQNPDLFSDIHWLDASSKATIELGLIQVAYAKSAPQEARQSSASVLQWISQQSNWLIIYDNADGDYSVVENFLPPGNGGSILITSRNGELKRLVVDSVNVLDMEDDEAVLLLLKAAMQDITSDSIKNAAKKVVSELGGIPLALDQAGAYIHRSGCGVDGYHRLYQKNKNKLMSRKEFKGASGYGRSTYGTWDISMKQIEAMAAEENGEEAEAAQNAIRLLRIFAFLNHENVPEEVFENAAENYMIHRVNGTESCFPMTLLNDQTLFLNEEGEWDKIQFLDGIQILLSFSFIRAFNQLYSMHILVNSWSRNHVPKTGILDHYHRARALLSCSIYHNWQIDSYAFCKLLAPHIQANIMYASELGLQTKYYDSEYDKYALVFHHVGNWDEAQNILLTALDERETMLGSDHYSTLVSMNNLAVTLRNQGRWDEAEKLQIKVMDVRKEKLGSDHPDTLISMHNLASTYQYQGKWAEAGKLLVEVIDRSKANLGSDHPNTLMSMGALAQIYNNQGKWDDAEKLQVDVMDTMNVILGPYHLSTLTIMENLALTYQSQGRWDRAEELQVKVLDATKDKLGSEHPETLITMHNLAYTYMNQGRFVEAEKLQVEVMNTMQARLGPDHPDTLMSMGNLAGLYQDVEMWDEAEKLQIHVMMKRKEKLGPNHPSTLMTMHNLAMTYDGQGKWDDAERLLTGVLDAEKETFGSDHPVTLRSMASLALIYKNQNRLDEAATLLAHTVQMMQQVIGFQHPTTCLYQQHLDILLKTKEEYQQQDNQIEE